MAYRPFFVHSEKFATLASRSEQFRWRQVQRITELFDIVDADITLPTLHRSYIGPMKARQIRQCLLGQAAQFPLPPQVQCKHLANNKFSAPHCSL
jgi:hypothetical protein